MKVQIVFQSYVCVSADGLQSKEILKWNAPTMN